MIFKEPKKKIPDDELLRLEKAEDWIKAMPGGAKDAQLTSEVEVKRTGKLRSDAGQLARDK